MTTLAVDNRTCRDASTTVAGVCKGEREPLMARPRILLADDHTLVAQALTQLLEREFDIVATVADGRALLEAAARHRPDVVIVDIGMPLLNGLDAGERLKALHPAIKVIYLTQNREPRIAFEAFKNKASGYVLKDAAASELTTAIHEALGGRWYASPAIAQAFAEAGAQTGTSEPHVRELTARERDVLQLLAEGKAMKEVAAILDISPRTVEFHKYRLMQTIGAKTTADLVQYAIRHGLLRS
jgi:DNA-binding NarL/FixJ family response regulator